MKVSALSLIVFLIAGLSNTSKAAESELIFSEKNIDFYVNSTDPQHSDSLVTIFSTNPPVSGGVHLIFGTFDLENLEVIDIAESKQNSLKEMAMELLKKTPTAVNFSEKVIQEGAQDWVKNILSDSGIRTFDSDGTIEATLFNKALLSEWEQAMKSPSRFSFRMGILAESVENLVRSGTGEGMDSIYTCLSGTYHKIFFEIVAAETIDGKKLNRIESSKTRFFYNTTIKEQQNLFLGSSVNFNPPTNASKQEIQAICDGLI